MFYTVERKRSVEEICRLDGRLRVYEGRGRMWSRKRVRKRNLMDCGCIESNESEW